MKLLLFGSTGLVGSHVLKLALEDQRISQIIAPVRKPLFTHPKLMAPVIQFENLPTEAPWWKADALICTLGTTMKRAGSKEKFARVDRDYPIAIAKLALKQGVKTYVLNSAMGADVSSRFFYNQIKGEVEDTLGQLGFHSFTIVRPGLIGGERKEFRPGEEAAKVVTNLIRPLLPKKLWINPPEKIAEKMIQAAVEGRPGRHILTSEQIIE